MREINLDLSDPTIIELNVGEYGKRAISIIPYINGSLKEIDSGEQMIITIQRTQTGYTSLCSIFNEDIGAFIYGIRKDLTEEAGDKPALVEIRDTYEGTYESYPAIWRVK